MMWRAISLSRKQWNFENFRQAMEATDFWCSLETIYASLGNYCTGNSDHLILRLCDSAGHGKKKKFPFSQEP